MNTLAVIVILATVACSSAYLEKCATEADCAEGQCCVLGRRCGPKLPVYSTCYLTNYHGCGCVEGSSCQITYSKTLFGKTFNFRQCVKDDVGARSRRFLIRKCSVASLAEDCGKERCCVGGKYCSPLIPKYFPCNFEESHKCPCDEGLECKKTKTLQIPGTVLSVSLKQCMPKEESVEVEEAELTEE